MENKEKTIWKEIQDRVSFLYLTCKIRIKDDILLISEFRNKSRIECCVYINGFIRGVWNGDEFKDSHHQYMYDIGKGKGIKYLICMFPSVKVLIREYKKRFKESEIEIID